MNAPNIFKFATKELSQDAVLAYILDWANPEYRSAHPKLNKLGEDLLCAMLASTKTKPIQRIEKLCVKTQYKRIDVSIEINDDIFLIIEDKIDTGIHSDQINRYKKSIKKSKPGRNIRAVYVKTGNESKKFMNSHSGDSDQSKNTVGCFLRKDLLKILENYPDTGNNIINEFTSHLRKLEDDTNSFKTEKSSNWSWLAHQGYYLAIEKEFQDKVKWRYVANPNGGSLVFWWKTKNYTNDCNVYVQIDHRKGLFIRASNAKNGKVSVDILRGLLAKAKFHVKNFDNIQIEKPAHVRSGKKTANFARIYFDGDEGDGGGSYLATDKEGIIDLEGTINRLKTANKLVSAMCNE